MMKNTVCWLLATGMACASIAAQSQPEIDDAPLNLKTFDCATHLEMTDLEDGRSDIVTVWAHGYYHGMRGVDDQSERASWVPVETFSDQLLKICGGDPEKLFISAVKQLARTEPEASRP